MLGFHRGQGDHREAASEPARDPCGLAQRGAASCAVPVDDQCVRLGHLDHCTGWHYSRSMDSSGAGLPLPAAARSYAGWWRTAAVLAVMFGVALVTGSLPSPEEVRDWAEGLGDLAYLAFVPLFVLANFVIAWPILAGAAGLLFGTAVGTPLALAGVTAAALPRCSSPRLAAGHHGVAASRADPGARGLLTRNGARCRDGVAHRARCCPTAWSTSAPG